MNSDCQSYSPTRSLGQMIRKVRKGRGLTQSECAAHCGVGHRHFQKIEAGEVNPPISFFKKLGSTLGARSCYFLNEENLDSKLSQANIACSVELLELMPVSVFVALSNGELLYKNRQFVEFFGDSAKKIFEILERSETETSVHDALSRSESADSRRSDSVQVLGKDGKTYSAQIDWKAMPTLRSQTARALVGVISLR